MTAGVSTRFIQPMATRPSIRGCWPRSGCSIRRTSTNSSPWRAMALLLILLDQLWTRNVGVCCAAASRGAGPVTTHRNALEESAVLALPPARRTASDDPGGQSCPRDRTAAAGCHPCRRACRRRRYDGRAAADSRALPSFSPRAAASRRAGYVSLVRIEISPHSESLNVPVAGAIALHAAARHRHG